MDAQSIYIQSSEVGDRLGPLIRVALAKSGVMGNLGQLRQKLSGEIKCTSPGTFWAPSAYHAAILLQDLQQYAITATDDIEPTERENVARAATGIGPLLFRGHVSNRYELTPSILRQSVDAGVMKLAARYFCEYFYYYNQHFSGLLLPPDVFLSGAQHYQIATDLLDFSADPDVAVFFASSGHNNVADDQVARVYVVPIRLLLKRGLRVLLPPPLFSRIYLQRGVFVQTAETISDKEFVKVEFPAKSSFKVYRGGKPVPIMPESTWLNEIKDWSIKVGEENDEFDERKLADLSLSSLAENEIHLRHSVHEVAKWVDEYEDMRYWLACTVNFAREEKYFARDIVAHIAWQNRSLHTLHRKIRKQLGVMACV